MKHWVGGGLSTSGLLSLLFQGTRFPSYCKLYLFISANNESDMCRLFLVAYCIIYKTVNMRPLKLNMLQLRGQIVLTGRHCFTEAMKASASMPPGHCLGVILVEM